MALPKSIQKQVETAAHIEQQLAQEAQSAPPPEPPIEVALQPQPDPLPVSEPSTTAPAPVAAAPAPTAPTPQQHDVWEARYKSLQGMFDSMVPKLQRQVAELSTKLEAASKPATPAPSEPPKPQASQRDIDDFGADLVQMVQRVAEQMLAPLTHQAQAKLTEFDARVAKLEQGVSGVSSKVEYTAEQAFFANLARMVPDYAAINEDQAFLAWLAEVDPVYGQPRQAALDHASTTLNADRAAAVFNAFKQLSARATASPQQKLEAQVSPSAGAAPGPVSGPATRQVLSTTQIQGFYNDVAKGRYRGRQAEQTRIENEINLALAEGRVRET